VVDQRVVVSAKGSDLGAHGIVAALTTSAVLVIIITRSILMDHGRTLQAW
jgi:hypothetical protein